jgi:hypothetical protein
MTDGQAAGPPQGTPSSRAPGAMESAARRARASAGGASSAASSAADAHGQLACRKPRKRTPTRSPPPTAPRRQPPRPRPSRRPVMVQRPIRPTTPPSPRELTSAPVPLVERDDHDPGHGAGFLGWTSGDLRPQPVERNRGAGRPDRWFELPELERPDRGHVQRSGGAHELSYAEHRHGPALKRASRPRRSRSTPRRGPRMG